MACPAKRNPVLFVSLERRILIVVIFLPSCIISSCLFPIFTLQVLLGFIVRLPDSFSPGSNLGPFMILLPCLQISSLLPLLSSLFYQLIVALTSDRRQTE